MDLALLGSVGRVAHEHEAKRSKNLEKLGKARKVATKAVETAATLLQPKAALQAEAVARGQTKVDRSSRRLKECTRELEDLGAGWTESFSELSGELLLLGNMKNWTETIELQLRSIKAELDHSQTCMKAWEELQEELQS